GTTRASARSCGAVRFGRPPTSQAVAAVHPSRSSASTSNSSRRHTDRPKDAYGVRAILPRPEGRGLPRTGSFHRLFLRLNWADQFDETGRSPPDIVIVGPFRSRPVDFHMKIMRRELHPLLIA